MTHTKKQAIYDPCKEGNLGLNTATCSVSWERTSPGLAQGYPCRELGTPDRLNKRGHVGHRSTNQ